MPNMPSYHIKLDQDLPKGSSMHTTFAAWPYLACLSSDAVESARRAETRSATSTVRVGDFVFLWEPLVEHSAVGTAQSRHLEKPGKNLLWPKGLKASAFFTWMMDDDGCSCLHFYHRRSDQSAIWTELQVWGSRPPIRNSKVD